MAYTITWSLLLALAMTASAYGAYQQNVTGSRSWFFVVWAIGVVPFWAVVSRFSKNLVLDAVLYDAIIAIVYFVALSAFSGQLITMGWQQYVGFLLVLAGIVLMRIH